MLELLLHQLIKRASIRLVLLENFGCGGESEEVVVEEVSETFVAFQQKMTIEFQYLFVRFINPKELVE
jgi:hypothetical protein